MTRDDIIRMAREAEAWPLIDHDGIAALERFAKLVAAAERERMRWDGIHTCGPTCDNPACVAVREAVEAEREACAKAVERSYLYVDGSHGVGYHDWHIAERVTAHCIAAIRARGSDEL